MGSCDKLKTLYLNFYMTFGSQTWQDFELQQGTPTISYEVLLSHDYVRLRDKLKTLSVHLYFLLLIVESYIK